MANEQTSVIRVADRGEIPLLLDKARQWRTFRRLHDQRPALPSSRQTFYDYIFWFQPERFDHSVSSIADQIRRQGETFNGAAAGDGEPGPREVLVRDSGSFLLVWTAHAGYFRVGAR